ncbi:unnamed protein product [Miscanthus lutarioriparius]|uniref:SAP domain-containing protein n=1 Tax=Miscanthus lutarioriparius TaxID=422564 RepID=A0A811RE77_9POAL|nr:unnamed protein product [Miscanthus lutarioriparius]
MEFAAMKRRGLLELCRQHGLATRGSKADLAAGLAGVLSLQGAAAAESVVGVVVGKGCLKRLRGNAGGGTSGASKKVRFALDETSEVKGRRRRSQVILSLVVAKTGGRRKARKALPSAVVSGRGRRRKRNDGGGSAHESVTREVGADAPLTQSRMKVVCLHAPSGVESQNNPAEAEEGGEVVGTATGRKQKLKAQENAEVIANSRAGISRRITRSLRSSAAAVLLPLDAEEKIGARKVDGNDELSAEEHAAGVQDLTIAASPVIIESSSSSRMGEDCVPSVQKPSKVVVSCRTTRLSSVAADVILPTVVGKKRRKPRGRPKARKTLPTATLGGRGSQQKCDVAGDSVDHGAFGEVGADAPVTQFGTKAVNSRAESGVESQNNLAEAEEEEEAVEATTYRKQKRKIQENAEDISANAPSGISHRRTRKSSSSPAAVLLSPVVEKMEVADDKDELGVKELAEVKILATTTLSIIVESKRKEEDYIPAELKPAKVEFYGRTTRSHSIAATVSSPTVIGRKVRKAEDVHPNGEVSMDLEVPRNDAPITKSLRNRVVHNSVVDETCARKKLEIKRKPSRPATHRHQPIVPSVEEKEQVAVLCKFSQHRRSSRNRPQADELLRNTDLENIKLSRVPVGGKDLSIAHRLTRNTAKTRLEDVESLSSGFKDRITMSYKDNIARNGGRVSLSDDNGNKASAAETALGVVDERTKGMHESVSNKEFKNAKGGDVGKQPAVSGCVRRSTRKSSKSVRI